MNTEPWSWPDPPAGGSPEPAADAGAYLGWSVPPTADPTAAIPPQPTGYGRAVPPSSAATPVGYGPGFPPYGYQYGYPAPEAPPVPKPPAPLSTAALVVGPVALIVALVPLLGLIAVPIGLVALLLGVLAVALERRRARAVTGAVLGVLALPLSLVMTVMTGGALVQTNPEDVRAEVVAVQELLDRDEYAPDDSVKVTFDDGSGNSVDYTVENGSDATVPGGLFVVDAVDAHGHVIASGWGEFESLDAKGSASEYSSYVEFDADVTHAATFDVRDLDANNALFDEWWNGEDATVEA